MSSCIICPDVQCGTCEYCDTHYRMINLQPHIFNRKKQISILYPFHIYLYQNYRINGQFEYRWKTDNNVYILDFCFWFKNKFWVVEIDEHGHRSYDKSKDFERTSSLLQIPGSVNLIRLNPDKYYEPLLDKIMPSVCEKTVVFLKDFVNLIERRVTWAYIRHDELNRRIGLLINLIEESFENDGVMIGESLHENSVTLRKLFF